MTYDEKRELRLQISQMLADAGLNQKVIKDMVEQEIKNKVDRAIDQTIKSLNAEDASGDFMRSRILDYVRSSFSLSYSFRDAVKEELKNRVIKVVLENKE